MCARKFRAVARRILTRSVRINRTGSERHRYACEAHFCRKQRIDMARSEYLLGNDVTLRTGHRSRPLTGGNMRLMCTDASEAGRAMALRIERRSRVDRAVARGAARIKGDVDDAIDVARTIDEALIIRSDHRAMTL